VLEQYLKDRRQKQEILLMTHIVLGHPHFDTSLRLVESMVQAGVDRSRSRWRTAR
jgi:tryptophan synthase alpha chain